MIACMSEKWQICKVSICALAFRNAVNHRWLSDYRSFTPSLSRNTLNVAQKLAEGQTFGLVSDALLHTDLFLDFGKL